MNLLRQNATINKTSHEYLLLKVRKDTLKRQIKKQLFKSWVVERKFRIMEPLRFYNIF
jgi:hypothetical protein